MALQSNQPNITPANVIRESSVFSGIQSSVHNNDKCNFSLLLSMVTQDALELDEFNLPHTQQATSTSDLAKTFHVVSQKLYQESNPEQDRTINQMINSGHKQSATLLLQLQPQALIISDDDKTQTAELPKNVFNNLNINQKARILKGYQSNSLNTSHENEKPQVMKQNAAPEVDIESWFSVLEQARTISKVA